MVAFARFETDPAGEIVMINVEKIVKFQELGKYTSLFLDDGSTIDVKGNLHDVAKRIGEASKEPGAMT
jgi:hypothetical protein